MSKRTPRRLADLVPDPHNRRLHNARNLGMDRGDNPLEDRPRPS